LLQYYNKNLDDYRIESKVRWEELMVRFDQFPSKEEAYKALVAMGNEVVYGAKFAAVAERASHGFTSEKGGIHDWTTEGSLVDKKLEEALFTLPLNELSDLIETKIGAHIVRVIERQQEGVMSFGEAQAGIKEKLIQENRSKAFDARLNQLRREIPYEIVWK
jgi:parvulin-like peptidyl-prolyl isomerase